MIIKQAAAGDLPALVTLALLLWPEHTRNELTQELAPLLSAPEAAFFLAFAAPDTPIGFAQCQLRHDYVGGASGSPTGYLEGLYVLAAHRRRGVARALLNAAQDWAKAQGCTEFASDCELHNAESLAFHLRAGFAEAGRIICFIKEL